LFVVSLTISQRQVVSLGLQAEVFLIRQICLLFLELRNKHLVGLVGNVVY